MTMLEKDSPVIARTKELCAAIAGDPEYQSLLQKVERFMEDEASTLQFQSVQERRKGNAEVSIYITHALTNAPSRIRGLRRSPT